MIPTTETRPTPLPVRVDGIPVELIAEHRWVVWKYEWIEPKNDKPGRWTKEPFIATSPEIKADSTDPTTWRTFNDALGAYEDGKCDGIGFTLGDGYVGFDGDKTDATEFVQIFNTYTERSPSGDGVHCICRGKKPGSRCRKGKQYELYDHARYLTVTGHHIAGTPTTVEERTSEIAVVYNRLFSTDVANDDDALIEKAKKAKNGTKFAALWDGQISEYPSHSEADAALCSLLAFWTRDAPQLDRLFRRSGLFRKKWDERRGESTYGAQLIARAISITPTTYSQQPRENQRTISLTFASEITPRPVVWLWEGRVPLGSLTLLAGREGIGKTTLAYKIAADITQGRLEGNCFAHPRTVIVAATEDSWSRTIVPRLMGAGADLTRVARVDVTASDGFDTQLSLPRDNAEVTRVVREVNAAMILLDPLISRLDSKLDTHKDAEVRRALEPLVHIANETNAVVWGIIHVNKGSARDPLNMVMGSRAFTAVARAVLFVAENPDDEHTRVLGQPKNNLGRTDLPTLTFSIENHLVATTEEGDIYTGKLKWVGETDRTIREIVEANEAGGDRTAVSEAADWLRDFLKEKKGAAESSVVKKAGKKAGHSESALKRARNKLKVTAESRGFPRQTWWLLPGVTLDEEEPGLLGQTR